MEQNITAAEGGFIVLNNWSVTRKLLAAFGGLIAIVVVAMGLNYRSLSYIQETEHWTAHTHRVLTEVSSAMAAMVDQETGLRAYLLAADARFLGPFERGGEDFARAFAAAKALTADNPAQQARLADLERQARAWRVDHAEALISMMRSDRREEARAREISGGGKAAMDGVRGLVAEISGVERDLLERRVAEAQESFAAAYVTMVAALVALVVIAAGAALLLYRAISVPVNAMTLAMTSLASGDLDVVVPGLGRRDEVGAMAGAVEVFKQNARERARLERDAREREEAAAVEKRRAMQELAASFDAKVGGLVDALSSSASEMEATARSMSQLARGTNEQSVSVASAAAQTSANVQTVAAATEELSASIQEIANQVASSSTIAQRAQEDARRTDTTVKSLQERTERIGNVVALINQIAGQTNLLALNATIEAARAGEAGRGFAVVASEVKELASQTSKATEEIAAQIGAVQGATVEVVGVIDEIARTIAEMSQISGAMAAAIEEQGTATREIARNVQEAARGTDHVTGNIDHLKTGAAETGAAASQVLGAASELARHSAGLRQEVDVFLAGVRAA